MNVNMDMVKSATIEGNKDVVYVAQNSGVWKVNNTGKYGVSHLRYPNPAIQAKPVTELLQNMREAPPMIVLLI